MKIKDLLSFRVFQDADFIDDKTCNPIYDQEKEIEDIRFIQINEEIDKHRYRYYFPRRWLTVFLVLKED